MNCPGSGQLVIYTEDTEPTATCAACGRAVPIVGTATATVPILRLMPHKRPAARPIEAPTTSLGL